MGGLLRALTNQVEMRYKNLREAFRRIDLDSSGSLSRDEVEYALRTWRIPASHSLIDALMASFDTDGDSLISFAEWCNGMKRNTVTSHAVFGREDKYVTDHFRLIDNGRQVIFNDNLSRPTTSTKVLAPHPPAQARSGGRPDFEAWRLPKSSQKSASPEEIKTTKTVLQDHIYVKFKLLRDAFRSFDTDHDGKLSTKELLSAARCFNLSIPEDHVRRLVEQCDRNHDGFIDYDEFAAALKRIDALGN